MKSKFVHAIRNLTIVFVTGFLFIATAPPASAADVTYANAVAAPEWHYVSSGVGNITGGTADVNVYIEQIFVGIETYLSHPGFTSFAKAIGPSTQPISMTHALATSHLSRCWWRIAGNDPLPGTADLTCSYSN